MPEFYFNAQLPLVFVNVELNPIWWRYLEGKLTTENCLFISANFMNYLSSLQQPKTQRRT